jgi:hypothetical protein
MCDWKQEETFMKTSNSRSKSHRIAQQPTPGDSGTATSGQDQSATALTQTLRTAVAAVGTQGSLTPVDRRAIRSRISRCPDTVIKAVLDIATRNGGQVVDTPVDVNASNDALAFADAYQRAVRAMRTSIQQLEDTILQRKVAVVDEVTGLIAYMDRIVLTPKGTALASDLADVHKLLQRYNSPSHSGSSSSAAAQAPGAQASSATPNPPPAASATPATSVSQPTAPAHASAAATVTGANGSGSAQG